VRKKHLILLSLFVTSLVFLVSGSNKVFAAANINIFNELVHPGQVNTYTYDTNGSTPYNNKGYLVVGTGEFKWRSLVFTIEASTPNPNITIEHADICGNKSSGRYGGIDDPVPSGYHSEATTNFIFGSTYGPIFNHPNVTGNNLPPLEQWPYISKTVVGERNCNSNPDKSFRFVTDKGNKGLQYIGKDANGRDRYGGWVYVSFKHLDNSGKSLQNSFRIKVDGQYAKVGYSSDIVKQLRTTDADKNFLNDLGLSLEFGISLTNTDLPKFSFSNYSLGLVKTCRTTPTPRGMQITFYDIDDYSASNYPEGQGPYWQGIGADPDPSHAFYGYPTVEFEIRQQKTWYNSQGVLQKGGWSTLESHILTGKDFLGHTAGSHSEYVVKTDNPLQPGYNYQFKIKNVYTVNAIQFSVPSTADLTTGDLEFYPCSRKPIAYVDSCELLSDGRTTRIRGWAYDDQGVEDKPTVQLKLRGGGDTITDNLTSERSYYPNVVENKLDSLSYEYGNQARDGKYGWEKTYTNLDPDEDYHISGKVFDTGGDEDQDLIVNGYNVTTSPPGDKNIFFPLSDPQLPSSCLPQHSSPVAYLDSCELDPVTGDTILYGWAYDNDANAVDKPDVKISVSGKPTKTVGSGKDYYPNRINQRLNDKGFGNNARDGKYGWEVRYGDLDVDTDYTVSGIVIDVATGGSNKPVRINQWNVATDKEENNFPGKKIPDGCKRPSAAVVCAASQVTFGSDEMTMEDDISVYIRHGRNSPVNQITVISVNFELQADMELSGLIVPTLNKDIPKNTTQAFSRRAKFNVAKTYNDVKAVVTYKDPDVKTITCMQDITVYNKPYLKAFGGDVWVGGKLGGSEGNCNTNKSIYAFTSGSGATTAGASGQFGVTALLNIKGFYSSSQRRGGPDVNKPPKGTTFANFESPGNVYAASTYGGGYNPTTPDDEGGGLCTTNYYNTMDPDSTSANGAFNGDFGGKSGKQQYLNSSKLILNSNITVPRGYQTAVYVDGKDVYINGNISYGTGPRSSIKDIPFFAIIVKGGNIYIDEHVTNIDGLFVAQPVDGSTGKIFTCSKVNGSNATLYGASENYTQCDQKLTVNGALYASKIRFLRNKTTVGRAGDINPEEPGDSNGAAEVINFNPELYLAPSPLSDNLSDDKVSPYESIFTLPPVF